MVSVWARARVWSRAWFSVRVRTRAIALIRIEVKVNILARAIAWARVWPKVKFCVRIVTMARGRSMTMVMVISRVMAIDRFSISVSVRVMFRFLLGL
jgi:hypothetical protein